MNENIYSIIKKEALVNHITIKDLERITGVPKGTLHRWGKDIDPKFSYVVSVSGFLGLSLNQLAYGKEPSNI